MYANAKQTLTEKAMSLIKLYFPQSYQGLVKVVISANDNAVCVCVGACGGVCLAWLKLSAVTSAGKSLDGGQVYT